MVEKKFEISISLPSSYDHLKLEADRALSNGGGGIDNIVAPDMAFDPEQAKCECCGLSEECTPAYIRCIREDFCGRFVCGLCAEAVKEEQFRMKAKGVSVPMEGALQAHLAICEQFRSIVYAKPAVQVAATAADMRQLLARRSIGVQRSSKAGLGRSTSCMPAITGKCIA